MKFDVPEGVTFGVTKHSYRVDSTIDTSQHDARFHPSYVFKGKGRAPWFQIAKDGTINPPVDIRHANTEGCGVQDITVTMKLFLQRKGRRATIGTLSMVKSSTELAGKQTQPNAVTLEFDWVRCTPSS